MAARSLPLVALLAAHALCLPSDYPPETADTITAAYKGPTYVLEQTGYYLRSDLDDVITSCYKEYNLDVPGYPCGLGYNVTVYDSKLVDLRIVFDVKERRFRKVTVSRPPDLGGECLTDAYLHIDNVR